VQILPQTPADPFGTLAGVAMDEKLGELFHHCAYFVFEGQTRCDYRIRTPLQTGTAAQVPY